MDLRRREARPGRRQPARGGSENLPARYSSEVCTMTALAFLGRHWKPIGATLAALVILWSIFSHFADDRATRAALETLRTEAGTVVIKLQEASGNPKVEWSTAAGQIVALGESNRALKS